MLLPLFGGHLSWNGKDGESGVRDEEVCSVKRVMICCCVELSGMPEPNLTLVRQGSDAAEPQYHVTIGNFIFRPFG